MMDKETRITLLNICKVLTDLTAVCRQINSDNERLLKENYLLSKEVKWVKSEIADINELLSLHDAILKD